MNIKHLAAITAAVCMAASLVACGNEIQKNDRLELPPQEDIITQAEESKPDDTVEEEQDQPVRSFDEVTITAKEAKYTKFSKKYNAESGSISGKAKQADKREGYEGKGYVTNITDQSDWEISFDLPSTQYYNISITVASDETVQNGIAVNGTKISEFTVSDSGKFETCTFRNIKLEEGLNKVSIVPENGVLDVDYVEVTASEDISKLSFKLKDPALSNKNAEYNAKALYQYLCDNFGSSVILGQYDTAGTTYESDLIYRTTGKNPAIRFGDMMQVTAGSDSADVVKSEIAAAEKWHEDGGIVAYMWNWIAPTEGKDPESIYAENTDFDISKAVTKEDVAGKSIDELKKLVSDKKISQECLDVIEDIDAVSEQLAVLRDEGIAVLWRPLQEASNGYFWWGHDEDSYKWLWKLMYQRMTNYHQLNNLVWVWSAQNSGWYVGNDQCDVLSVDVYDDSNGRDGQVNSLLYLQSVCANKPIAMSECGSFPDIQSIADEKAMWSYIGQWGGNFIVDEEGKLSEEHNTEADLITMYNNNLTVTREKLPDFITLANEIKQKEEEESKDAKDTKDTKKSDSSSEKSSDSKSSNDKNDKKSETSEKSE